MSVDTLEGQPTGDQKIPTEDSLIDLLKSPTNPLGIAVDLETGLGIETAYQENPKVVEFQRGTIAALIDSESLLTIYRKRTEGIRPINMSSGLSNPSGKRGNTVRIYESSSVVIAGLLKDDPSKTIVCYWERAGGRVGKRFILDPRKPTLWVTIYPNQDEWDQSLERADRKLKAEPLSLSSEGQLISDLEVSRRSFRTIEETALRTTITALGLPVYEDQLGKTVLPSLIGLEPVVVPSIKLMPEGAVTYGTFRGNFSPDPILISLGNQLQAVMKK